MAGLARSLTTALVSIPIQNVLSKRLAAAWRATTGTEPPTAEARKQRAAEIKKAKKAKEPPPEQQDPPFLDSLMWAALTAMSVVAVRVAAERIAEEGHRFFTGKNPPVAKRDAVYSADESGRSQAMAALANRTDD